MLPVIRCYFGTSVPRERRPSLRGLHLAEGQQNKVSPGTGEGEPASQPGSEEAEVAGWTTISTIYERRELGKFLARSSR